MEIIRNIRSKLAPPLSPERKALRESIWQETLEFQNMREGWSSPLSKMKRSEKEDPHRCRHLRGPDRDHILGFPATGLSERHNSTQLARTMPLCHPLTLQAGIKTMNDVVEPRESPAAPLLRYLLAPLADWLDDPSTEDLCINRPGEAWVRQRGRFTRHEIPLGLDELEDIAILSAALRRQDIGTSTPLCATELPDGQRLQICLAPAVPARHDLAIDPPARVRK